MELLQEEFVSYQLLSDTDIPSEVWAEAKVGEDEEAYHQIDIFCVRFWVLAHQRLSSRDWLKSQYL